MILLKTIEAPKKRKVMTKVTKKKWEMTIESNSLLHVKKHFVVPVQYEHHIEAGLHSQYHCK